MTSLMGKDIVGSDGTATYAYYMNVCGPLTSTAAASCTAIQSTSSACQVQVSDGTGAYDTGNWIAAAPPTWGYIDPSAKSLGVMYSMQGAQSCWAQPPAQYYVANILFTCSTKTGPLAITIPARSCIQNYTYPTPLACGGGSGPSGGGSGHKKKGLSGGWVFIIILCVVLPLYVVGGCVYKSQKQGATGMEKCPNIDFWRNLPGLCKDGCVFTFRKLRGLCSGGGSKGEGSYETM